MMSDDAKSQHRPRRSVRRVRVLVVSNASPESTSEDSMSHPEPQKQSGYYPRPLPSPSRSLPSTDQFHQHQMKLRGAAANSHIPTPLTTNLHSFPSSRSNPSNPALSSPSSTSSPAVESTPPPSTPGLTGPYIHGSDEGTIRQEMINPVLVDRNDATPQASRPRMFERITSRLPSNVRRNSSSGSRPATSPTVSTSDSYMPTPPRVLRSSPMEKVLVLVTTDADNLHIVDITGALTPAFIRERIFTKLQISDEDQVKFAIYRTEIGQFAIGEALTDDELFELYRDRGDHAGTLKLLVSHTSASVHEPMYDQDAVTTVNTIPPPVLPPHFYEPLRPKKPNRLRQGSQSSTSEPHHAEVGYEASVSDDLDHGDAEGGLPYGRPTPRALPIPTNRPPSPVDYHRSRSPGNLLSPERSTARSPESYRQDTYFPILSANPLPGTSPQNPRLVDESHPLPPLPPDSASVSTPPERERTHTNDSQSSSYPDRQQRAAREQERERDRRRRDRDVRKEGGRYARGPDDLPDSRPRNDAWTIVPPDVPSSGYKKDRPTTPQEGRSARFPLPSPLLTSYRPQQGEPSRSRKRQVPINWPVNWKHGPSTKTEHKPTPSPPTQILRPGVKSMTDMRGAFKHPQSLQPGRNTRVPPHPPLPLHTQPRPSTGGSIPGGTSLPGASGEASFAHPDQGLSPDAPRSALSPLGYMRQITTSHGSSSGMNSYLASPALDPYPRPHSALGESSSPFTQPRYTHSHQNSETYNDAMSHRLPSAPASNNYGTSSSYRDDAPRMVVPPSHGYADQQSAVPTGPDEYSERSSRTPPRSPVGTSNGYPESSTFSPQPPGAGFISRGAIDEDGTLHSARMDDRPWEGFIDENAAEGTVRPRKQLPTQQLPTPPSTSGTSMLLSSSSGSTLTNGSRHVDDESDSDNESGNDNEIWAKKPDKVEDASRNPRPNTRPPLTPLSIEPSPSSTSSPLPSVNPPVHVHDYGRSPPPNFPAPPDFLPPALPPPRTPKRSGAINHKSKDRISKFDNNFDVTWAPRPPPEVMYERLEEYFPEHDLDKPVIDAPSGGTSPTATEAPTVLPALRRHKKSIRVVAAEHKRQLDRTSRGDDSTIAPISRKRNTKLWGSKLEEVTTEQGKGPLSSASSDSSPGGAKPIFRWVRGELIGKGTYGRVYLALNATTGEMIAVKQVEIPRTASDKVDTRQVSVVEALKLESETLKDLDHSNIVQYLGFEETPAFLSIFLEYVPGGSIASCLRKHGRFDEEVTKSFTGQILEGLEYLHSRGILHRDMKADNILVETSGVCKISDFGISKRTDDIEIAAAYTSLQGTVFWMAPEVVNSKGKGYNSKIDIWSVGGVVFEMWTGQRPWSGQEAMAVLLHLYSTKQAPPVPAGIVLSDLADDFRLQCFAADPDERPTATELRKHAYLELQPGWTFNGFK